MYAYYVLNDLVPQADTINDPEQLDLPEKLEDFYREDFKRRVGPSDSDGWTKSWPP